MDGQDWILSNGHKVPCIGFGTWQIPSKDAPKVVQTALNCGYRHIDCAASYENERGVGEGIARSDADRASLFITSKLPNDVRGYEETLAQVQQTLDNLQLDYLDLYLIHWPNPAPMRDRIAPLNALTWKAMEDLYAQGKLRAIGVSNFRKHHLEQLLYTAKIAPMVNQIEFHPGFQEYDLLDTCRQLDMLIEAYSPLANGQIFALPQMLQIATEVGKSVAQVCLKWILMKGVLPLPKSMTQERMIENITLFDFTLTPQQIATIDDITETIGLNEDPDTVNF